MLVTMAHHRTDVTLVTFFIQQVCDCRNNMAIINYLI